MLSSNGIPLISLILETATATSIAIVAFLVFQRYRERRKLSTFYLFITLAHFGAGVTASAVGKYLEYFAVVHRSDDYISFLSLNLTFCLVGIGNTFLYAFVEAIYLSDSNPRKYTVMALHGIFVGLILGNLSTPPESYTELLPFIIPLILFGIAIYVFVIVINVREIRKTESRQTVLGLFFIGLFALFMISVFVFIGIDVVKNNTLNTRFNPEYYVAWSSSLLAAASGYGGFIRPYWLQRAVGVK